MTLVELTREELEIAVEMYMAAAQLKVNKHFERYDYLQPPTLILNTRGSKYWKVIKRDASGNDSVFSFIRIEDGALLKPATWRAPYVKGNNYVRGYVNDESHGMNGTTAFGTAYSQ